MSSAFSISASIKVPSISKALNKVKNKIQRAGNLAIRKILSPLNGIGIGVDLGFGFQQTLLEDLFRESEFDNDYPSYDTGTSFAEEMFQADKTHLWETPSIYGASKIKGQAPYNWVSLTDDAGKTDRQKDTQASPIGSINRDVTRITALLASTIGTNFNSTQVDLQKLNAFTEIRSWNKDSIIASTQRLPGKARVNRHIGTETDITGIAKLAMPGGTPIAIAKSVQVNGNSPYAGFLRGETGNRARNLFTSKWGAGQWGSSPVSGNSQDSTTSREDANWDIRPEYTDVTDKNVFKAFLTDKNELFTFKVGAIEGAGTYKASDINKYYGGKDGRIYSPRARVIQYPANSTPESGNNNLTGKTAQNQKLLATQTFKPNESNGKVGIPRDEVEFSTETTGDVERINGDFGGYQENMAQAAERWKKLNAVYKDTIFKRPQITYAQRMEIAKTTTLTYGSKQKSKSLEVAKKFGGAQRADEYNMIGVIDGGTMLDGSTRSRLIQGDGLSALDTIFFYFHDIINNKFIPFRATLTGISENTSTNWDDVQYMGRADKLLTYNGFSREMNFGFSVNAGSIKELIPMWNRINYISGLTRPAKYTQSTGQVMSNFIYPPLIKITIGDLYNEQPGVISSFGLTVPDESPWETMRVGLDTKSGTYTYLENTTQEIQVNNVMSRQLPLNVNITISMKLFEKKLAMTGQNLYFDPTAL